MMFEEAKNGLHYNFEKKTKHDFISGDVVIEKEKEREPEIKPLPDIWKRKKEQRKREKAKGKR